MNIKFLEKGATIVVADVASSYIIATDVAGRTLGHLKASPDDALCGWDLLIALCYVISRLTVNELLWPLPRTSSVIWTASAVGRKLYQAYQVHDSLDPKLYFLLLRLYLS